MKPSVGRWPIIALVGQTNSGKSSLFNLLVRQQRAIVAREEGTTRDAIGELVEIKEQKAWLVDTAGLKDPDDDFEATIQEQIGLASQLADIVLLLVDSQMPPTTRDRQLAKQALKEGKKIALVVNKIDKKSRVEAAEWGKLAIGDIFPLSVHSRQGLRPLVDYLANNLPKRSPTTWPKACPVAIIGRPNVGKSSLFNALLAKQQALVNPQAGTTRDVNRQFLKNHQELFLLADTAGLKRSGKTPPGVEKFSALRTLTAINQAEICLLVIDARQPKVKLDQKIANLVALAKKGLIIVVNKWDLVDNKKEQTGIIFKKIQEEYAFIHWSRWLFASAQTGQNVSQIIPLVRQIQEVRQKTVATAKLNDWLKQSQLRQPRPDFSANIRD